MLIEIPGDPIPKARARTTRRGTYDPQSDKKNGIKALILAASRKDCQNGLNLPHKGPLSVILMFYLPTPSDWSKKKLGAFEANPSDFPHITKPDTDNLAKFFLDCANKILYNDDAQIVDLEVRKYYSTKPHTCAIIRFT